jgi:hypothetical protein
LYPLYIVLYVLCNLSNNPPLLNPLVGYWIDYIKHTIQCIEGTKGVGYWIDYIKHTIQCIEGTKGVGYWIDYIKHTIQGNRIEYR